MSIIVKGVSVPKNCYTCAKYRWSPLCPCWHGDAKARYYRTSRHQDCPLIEVQSPHGRLVDGDVLMTEVMDSDLDHLQRDDWKEVIQIVVDAPTIIEAEGSNE